MIADYPYANKDVTQQELDHFRRFGLEVITRAGQWNLSHLVQIWMLETQPADDDESTLEHAALLRELRDSDAAHTGVTLNVACEIISETQNR